jgi:hypothetical protein
MYNSVWSFYFGRKIHASLLWCCSLIKGQFFFPQILQPGQIIYQVKLRTLSPLKDSKVNDKIEKGQFLVGSSTRKGLS